MRRILAEFQPIVVGVNARYLADHVDSRVKIIMFKIKLEDFRLCFFCVLTFH